MAVRQMAVVLIIGMGLLASACGASLTTPETEAAGEVFLEAKLAPGPDPFQPDVVLPEIPELPPLDIELVDAGPDATEDAEAEVLTVSAISGDEVGLYGGSLDNAVCDPEQLAAFMDQNPDKAAAWAETLDIEVADIRDFIQTLTPVVLRNDTRVTNHGFADGRATPRQSILEAGTAVMVDDKGVPRVRCACGNPLLEPAATSGRVTFNGEPWAGFDAGEVVAVTDGDTQDEFDLLAAGDETLFTRPVGTAGEEDVSSEVLAQVATPTTAPTPTAEPTETPTPEPTATPTPGGFAFPTPTPLPTAGPTPTPLPTSTPTNTPTPGPSPTPTRTPTPRPTNTPAPPTPTPRNTPVPTATPRPTNTPVPPTATPTPTPTNTPVPSPTPTPTNTPVLGQPPRLINASLSRVPSFDSSCEASMPGTLGVQIFADYVDGDGDALGSVVGVFGPTGIAQAISVDFNGDSSSGTLFGTTCGFPNATITFTLTDQAGNTSNGVTVTTPPD